MWLNPHSLYSQRLLRSGTFEAPQGGAEGCTTTYELLRTYCPYKFTVIAINFCFKYYNYEIHFYPTHYQDAQNIEHGLLYFEYQFLRISNQTKQQGNSSVYNNQSFIGAHVTLAQSKPNHFTEMYFGKVLSGNNLFLTK